MTVAGSHTRVGSRFGQYELRRLLGRGGMGEVYEAYDTAKDRVVAVKILADHVSNDDTYRERFRRESHAAAKLAEPHVIPIHDWGNVDGTLYIDMRLVRGVDLHRLLSSGPLEPQRAVAITGQVASALDAAHADGLVHRDVKPENILVTPDDFAYLVDFGIAGSTNDPRLTTAGTAIGSLAYMAPERLGGQPATKAADIYALACVLYESLTGAPPFPTRSMPQVIVAHSFTPPPRPSASNPAVPAALDDVIAHGMAKEPEHRYRSAGALGRAAEQALRAGAAPPRATRPLAPDVRHTELKDGQRRWVRPTIIATLIAALVVLVGLTAAHFLGRGPNSPTGRTDSNVSAPPTATLPAGANPCPILFGPISAYTRSAVGNTATSCPFAEQVRLAYGGSAAASSTPRQINVYSPVTRQFYPMTCTANGPLVTCAGGDALVYVY